MMRTNLKTSLNKIFHSLSLAVCNSRTEQVMLSLWLNVRYFHVLIEKYALESPNDSN